MPRHPFGNVSLAIGLAAHLLACSAHDTRTTRVTPDSGSPEPEAPSEITHGSQVNALNTGVLASHESQLADVSSSIVVTEDWITASNGGRRVLEDCRFDTGQTLEIHVDNFTVSNCRFLGTSSASVGWNEDEQRTYKDVTFEHCEFDGQHLSAGGAVALGGSGIIAKRVHIHRWPRAMWIGDGFVRVEESYMHELTADDTGAHIENIYVAGGAHLQFARNKLVSDQHYVGKGQESLQTSASLAIYNESYTRGKPYPEGFTALDDIVVEDNYLESDGWYALYGGACIGKQNPYAKHVTIRGNIFGRHARRLIDRCGGAAVAYDSTDPTNKWLNNKWGPRSSDCPDEAAEGTEIAAPTAS